jgi:hypothetical protein
MTSSESAVKTMLRYSLVTVESLHRAIGNGRSIKATEAALAKLQADGMVNAYAFVGNRKIYGLSVKAARIYGLNEKRFSRPPGHQAIFQNLAHFYFCLKTGNTLLTRSEFSQDFPELAAYSGLSRNRYFYDRTDVNQPRLGLICADFGADHRKVAKKARREFMKRKSSDRPDFKTFVMNGLLVIHVVTPFERKAERIRSILANEGFRYAITVIPELDELLGGG